MMSSKASSTSVPMLSVSDNEADFTDRLSKSKNRSKVVVCNAACKLNAAAATAAVVKNKSVKGKEMLPRPPKPNAGNHFNLPQF